MRGLITILLVIFSIVGGFYAFVYYCYTHDPELAGKRPYSALQIAEFKNRDLNPNVKILYHTIEEFCAAGIKLKNDRTWILLNYSDDLNGVYTIGDDTYSLTQKDYDEMAKSCPIDAQVGIELKKHL